MHEELFHNFLKKQYSVKLEDKKFLFELNIENEIAKLEVSVPSDYPYTFLQVKLINKKDLNFSMPHMISGDYLCLYDLDNDRHDYKNYLIESEETINRAKELLILSKRDELSLEYKNEFYDLWTAKEYVPIYSIISNYTKSAVLNIIKCNQLKYKDKVFNIVADRSIDIDPLINLFDNLSLHKYEIIGSAIYIPVEKASLDKPINNLLDLLKLIENENSFNFFLNQVFNNKIEFIFLGISNKKFPTPTLVALGLPEITTPKGEITKLKSYHNILKFNGSKKIIRLGLTDISQDRLFTRGGEGVKTDKLGIYLIGCGSLGGFLSKALCDTGQISEMLLQDNQLIQSENIGRHLCGLDSIEENKAVAVSKKININYPAMKISTVNHSFIQDILANKNTLKDSNYDLLICATGDENIEEEVINLRKMEIIDKPILIAWVEPFLIAGHFILINSPINKNTENYIFDANKNIKLGIVENASLYIKSEAGCQSHFMPYSGFEMQMFSQFIADQLINNQLLERTGNYHVTWFGKMREARKNNIKIKSKWRYKNDREIVISRIDE
ncbi:ThiF family adenylyltransferase [uncultured Vagococcus sp.]|uniref:ThiF family adenylyltransferase n=1 Tax=uncultured Vagococcus sp. TaxID=189676 RepID=UPI002589FCA0|nr:ThiF family adenylyltransferase [uncultured Vagococcus sp.]